MLKYSMGFVFKDSVLAEMLQTEHVYHCSVGFVYKNSVSIIILRWNTNRVRVTLHVKIFDGFCIQ
jgi:hypothetical protein